MRCSLSRPARTLTRRLRFLDLTVRRSGLEGQRAVAKHVFEMLVDGLLTIVLARHGDVRGAAAARRLRAGVVAPVPAVRRHGPERQLPRGARYPQLRARALGARRRWSLGLRGARVLLSELELRWAVTRWCAWDDLDCHRNLRSSVHEAFSNMLFWTLSRLCARSWKMKVE